MEQARERNLGVYQRSRI